MADVRVVLAVSLHDEIRLGFAQVKILCDPAAHKLLGVLEDACLTGLAQRDTIREAFSVRVDRLIELNEILDTDLGEPPTTHEELERAGVIL